MREWVAIPFSRRSSWPRDWTRVSYIAGRFFTIWAIRVAQHPVKCWLISQVRVKGSCGFTVTIVTHSFGSKQLNWLLTGLNWASARQSSFSSHSLESCVVFTWEVGSLRHTEDNQRWIESRWLNSLNSERGFHIFFGKSLWYQYLNMIPSESRLKRHILYATLQVVMRN